MSAACYYFCGFLYLVVASIFNKPTEDEERKVNSLSADTMVAGLLVGIIAIISVWPVWWAGDIYDQIRGKK